MTDQLPAPLVPADADLRDFPFMMLDVVRLRNSGLAVETTGDQFRAAILLICASWHELPAGSLPDNDFQLSRYTDYGREIEKFRTVKDGALRGWRLCSDGRFYHHVVAEKVNKAWLEKRMHRWKKECERIRKANKERAAKGLTPLPAPILPDGLQPSGVPAESAVPPGGVPAERSVRSGGIPAESAGPSGGGPAERSVRSGGIPAESAGPSGGGPVEPAGHSGGGPAEPAGPSGGAPVESAGPSGGIPAENSLKGRERGKGKGREGEEKKESSSSSSAVPARDDDDGALFSKLQKAARNKLADDIDLAPIRQLIAEGVSLELDVLPCLSERAPKFRNKLGKFDMLIEAMRARSRRRQTGALESPSPDSSPAARVFVAHDDARYEPACRRWRAAGRRGPPPDGCANPAGSHGSRGWMFPAEFLATGDPRDIPADKAARRLGSNDTRQGEEFAPPVLSASS